MDLQDFQDVTKITFKKRKGAGAWKRWFSVSDPDKVRRLLSMIRLKPFGSDPRPGCKHELLASFQKDSGDFDVDFCMVCFGACYMPEEFYTEFLRLARRHRRSVAILWCVAILPVLGVAIGWHVGRRHAEHDKAQIAQQMVEGGESSDRERAVRAVRAIQFIQSGETQQAVQILSTPIASYYTLYKGLGSGEKRRAEALALIEQLARTNQAVAARIAELSNNHSTKTP